MPPMSREKFVTDEKREVENGEDQITKTLVKDTKCCMKWNDVIRFAL